LASAVGEQAWILLLTVLAGMVLGLFFDVFRVGRQIFRPSRYVLFFLDLLFWLLAALFVFLVLLAGNRGEVRAFIFAGLSAGWLLYALLFSRTCYRLMAGTVSALLSLCRALLTPLVHLYRFFSRLSSRFKKALSVQLAGSRRQLKKLKDILHKKQE